MKKNKSKFVKRQRNAPATAPGHDPQKLTFRSATLAVRAAEGDTPASVVMSISSETPVLTWIWYNDNYHRVLEILDHSQESIDMSRCKGGLVVLDRHNGDQIGLMQVKLKDKKLGGAVEFCTGQRAQEIEQDALKGLRRNVSIGYVVDESSYVLEGEQNGVPVVRATRWIPYEASFVPIPADTNVGVGRAQQPQPQPQNNESKKRTRTMKEQQNTITPESVVEIYRLARAFGMEPGAADEHIKSGKTVDEFRELALKKAEEDRVEAMRKAAEKPQTHEQGTRQLDNRGLDEAAKSEIKKRFSILNVVRHMDAAASGRKSGVDIGFELEISQEIASKTGRKSQGILIPHEAPLSLREDNPFLKAGNGAAFVSTDLRGDLFIDALQAELVLARAGAITLDGLVGDIAIPKGGNVDGGWVDGENNDTPQNKPTVGQVTGTPKTAGGFVDASRRLINQSSISAEGFVTRILFQAVARLLDKAGLAGTGDNGQPKGVVNVVGVNNPNIATPGEPTRAELTAFRGAIASDNAAMGALGWIFPSDVWQILANTSNGILSSGETILVNPGYVLDVDGNRMLGNATYESNLAPAKSLFLGDWSQLIMALWSGVDLIVDPYSLSKSGAVRIVALQDADIMLRHPEAFAFNLTVGGAA